MKTKPYTAEPQIPAHSDRRSWVVINPRGQVIATASATQAKRIADAMTAASRRPKGKREVAARQLRDLRKAGT